MVDRGASDSEGSDISDVDEYIPDHFDGETDGLGTGSDRLCRWGRPFVNKLSCLKAKMWTISSDAHQLLYIPKHHFII